MRELAIAAGSPRAATVPEKFRSDVQMLERKKARCAELGRRIEQLAGQAGERAATERRAYEVQRVILRDEIEQSTRVMDRAIDRLKRVQG
jgi:hypothetical protein